MGIRPTRRPADDPGWAYYGRTVIVLHRRGRESVALDCRAPVTGAVRQRLHGIGLAGRFVVLTACNPGGTPCTPAENRRRTAHLARRIRAVLRPEARSGTRPIRADGGSPDRSHVEPGWAVPLPLPAARRLAADDGQSAIFRFDCERLWIEPVLVDAPARPLPEHDP